MITILTKRIIAYLGILSVLVMSFAPVVFAQESSYATVEQTGANIFKVSGLAVDSDYVTVSVYKSDKDASDLVSGEKAANKEVLFYQNQLTCTGSGDFEDSFMLSGELGSYTVYFGGAEIAPYTFEYESLSTDEELFKLTFDDANIAKGGWDSIGTNWSYATLDSEGVFAGTPNSNGYSTLTKVLTVPQTSGLYRLSLEYMTQTAYSTYIMAKSSDGERIELMCFRSDLTYGLYPDTTGYTLEGSKEYALNTPYAAELLLDLDGRRAYLYVGGVLIDETSLPERFADIARIELAINGAPEGQAYFDNVRLAKITSAGGDLPDELRYNLYTDISGGYQGNIMDGREPVEFKLNAYARFGEAPGTASAELILKQNEEVLYSNTYNVTFTDGSVSETLRCKALPFGIYTLQLTVRNADGDIIGYTEEEFSSVNTAYDIKNHRTGVSAHFLRRNEPDTMLDVFGATGSGLIRDDLRWADYEKSAGAYAMPDRIQKVLDWAKSNNSEVMLILGNENSLYNNTSPLTTDDARKAFGNYCYDVALKTKDTVQYFEVWNEYNISYNKGIANYTPENYALMLKTAYTRVKDANPDAMVFFGGIARKGSPLEPDVEWVESVMKELLKLYEADGVWYFDAISVHPYCFDSPENAELEQSEYVNALTALKSNLKEYLGAENYQAYLAQKKCDEIPIWVSEMGWPSSEHWNRTITEKMQADYTVRLMGLNDMYDLAENVTWYDLENDGRLADEQEHNFGLVNCKTEKSPNSAKPVYLALSNYNAMTNGAVPNTEASRILNDGTYIVRYDSDESMYMCWNINGDTEFKLSEICGSDKLAVVYDIYGNETAKLGSGESITIGESPVYIKAVSADLSCIRNDDGITVIAAVPQSVGATPLFCVGIKRDEILQGVYTTEQFTLSGGIYTAEIKLQNFDEGVVTAYLWNNSDVMRPLTDSISMTY